jgi:hypothetical protein
MANAHAVETNIESDIVIDGVIDEGLWHTVSEITTNYQVFPQTLNQQNNNFTYRTLTTEKGVFLALEAQYQQNLRVRTQEKDKTFSNDHFQIMIDINNNAQESYVFAINHQGNYFDGIYNIEKEVDLDWNAQWEYQVNVKKGRWTAEVFIPWSTMTFSVEEKNEFGLYISRFDESNNATYASAPVNQQMNSFFQQFTEHSATIISEQRFDFFPYLSWNRDILNNENSNAIGAEIFWQPSDGQSLSATVNPDFGQVESDELVVNFSAIESFFSEKRPFFNDNQSLFEVTGPETLRVVHSPRIGGSSYYDDGYTSKLNSALKYSINKTHYDIGILSAYEDSTSNGDGRDFIALRGQYLFDTNKLGASINVVNTPTIERKATVISSDLHYVVSENTSFKLGVIKAEIEENSVVESDIGWWVTGSSDVSEQHIHEFSLFAYGDNLQLNDIGYVKRINRKQFEYEYQYQIPTVNSPHIRDITFVIETEFKTNFQGEQLPAVIGSGIEIVTTHEFEYQLSIETLSAGFDDLVTRDHNSLWLPAAQNLSIEVASPEYIWGNYEVELTAGKEGWSGVFYDFQGSIKRQFNENIHIRFALSQYSSDSWIDWDEDNIINEFNFTEQGIELNIDYKISENQALRIKFESVIGKAKGLASYWVQTDGTRQNVGASADFSFSENAVQLRYKYAFSKLTAFYLSYGFGGEYEDEIAEFGKRNLYKKALKTKNAHNVFAKIRLHF